jgi:hypothetical protein
MLKVAMLAGLMLLILIVAAASPRHCATSRIEAQATQGGNDKAGEGRDPAKIHFRNPRPRANFALL